MTKDQSGEGFVHGRNVASNDLAGLLGTDRSIHLRGEHNSSIACVFKQAMNAFASPKHPASNRRNDYSGCHRNHEPLVPRPETAGN